LAPFTIQDLSARWIAVDMARVLAAGQLTPNYFKTAVGDDKQNNGERQPECETLKDADSGDNIEDNQDDQIIEQR
jgi:hypothetical protein